MAVQNSLTKQNSRLGIGAYLSQDAIKNRINEVVGGENGQRLITAIISATTANTALQTCSNQSILSAALVGESLKLSPSPQLGQYYMVPFKNSRAKTTEAQFQLGYKGYIQLALRSGQYKKLNVMAIKEGELVRFNPLDEEIEVNLIQDELQREKAKTIGYYAMFEYLNGFKKAIYWSREKMESHALKYSKGYQAKKGYTFWEKDFDGMAYKTMLRQLISKWGIMSIDMQTALDSDMAVINEDGSKNYVDTEINDLESTEIPNSSVPKDNINVVEVEADVIKEKPDTEDINSVLFG
ncbi:MAG: recombinase RecT [Clostridiales bacterium]|uniref:recombinase RecT n=1 Tax=Peptostreptococcus porci TaxID=2652282 RepID=UPI0029D63D4B|nr:recombinase RecT [Peptostreptococcus porci]MCI5698454.1 recombinase RecT [Clostridiales bacterium]MDY4129520.1 recombinase RecT [Peptostreptococcus porci]